MIESINWAVLPRQRLASFQASQDYRRLVANPDVSLKHLKPSDVRTMMTCQDVTDTESVQSTKYQVPRYEDDVSNNALRINFMTYEHQSQCTIHGPCGLGKNDECHFCLFENAWADETEDKENVTINKGRRPKLSWRSSQPYTVPISEALYALCIFWSWKSTPTILPINECFPSYIVTMVGTCGMQVSCIL
jgi:hypothetical protein